MKLRDIEYLEDRLLAPAGPLQEAIARLYTLGYQNEAIRLEESLKRLHDDCREIRREILTNTRHINEPHSHQ